MQFVIRIKDIGTYIYIHRTQSYNNVLWTDDINKAQVYTEAGAKSCVRQRRLGESAEIVEIRIVPFKVLASLLENQKLVP